MAHVCPWWGGYFIDNRLRHWLHDPERIVAPYVRPGMTVIDIGCGMGFFSIALARMVGPAGQVLAVDLQPQLLRTLERRARRAGVADRIRTRQAESAHLGIDITADFAVAFAMVHEVPDARRLLEEVHACLAPAGRFLVAEPIGHVRRDAFQRMIDVAQSVGLRPVERPRVRLCHAVVFAGSA